MTSSKNTLYIDCDAPHLAQALIPLIQDHIPGLEIADRQEALLKITLKNGKITLQSNERITLDRPAKAMVIIQALQNAYAQSHPIYIGPYLFDYGARTLTEGNNTLHLTEKEAEVLSYLDQNRDKGITRDDLLKNVWGYADGIDTHTIETHIYRLRQKIEKNPLEAAILLTHEDGYQLVKKD